MQCCQHSLGLESLIVWFNKKKQKYPKMPCHVGQARCKSNCSSLQQGKSTLSGHTKAEQQACFCFQNSPVHDCCSLSSLGQQLWSTQNTWELWEETGLRVTNSGNSSSLAQLPHEQVWSEHLLAQNTNTNFSFHMGRTTLSYIQAQYSRRAGVQKLDRSFKTFS